MIRALAIGSPSSVKATAPASRSSTISVSSSPFIPTVTVAAKPTGTEAWARACSRSAVTAEASSTGGAVLAIAMIPQ